MPFSCRVDGGAVLLAPTAPQTYKIYGHREKKRLTTCSPYDPNNCHTWFIYRFDLDCGGSRTSWQSVVGALSRVFADAPGSPRNAYPGHYDGQAGAGRMPPLAYAPRRQARPYRHGAGPVVDFPPGFAPNPRRTAKFERTNLALAPIPLPPKKPALKKPVLTAPAQIAEIAPNREPATAPSASGGKADVASETPPVEDKATTAAKSEVTKSEPVQIALSSGNGEATGSRTEPPATGSLPKSGTTGTLWRDAGVVFTVTFAVLLALTALLFLRRRRMETMPVPFALLPLKRAARSLFTGASNSGPARDNADLQSDVPATRLRLWDEDWLPATRNQALEVLGVDPDARADTIKITVTRLRRALHPDHAFDEEDLALRERRLKQINVAWDIVSGKRHAA